MGFFSSLFKNFFGGNTPSKSIESESYTIDVVGESNYQRALERICGGRTTEGHEKIVSATLVCEDNNPYDANAIRVDIEGYRVGYLSRDNAKKYRERLTEAGHVGKSTTCSARITGGWNRGGGDRGDFGVKIALPVAKQDVSGGERQLRPLEFKFLVDSPNEWAIDDARVGEPVNFWTPPDEPKKIIIFRRYSYGGDGRLGSVSSSYAGRIAKHRAKGLPIEAQIEEFRDDSCVIRGRFVPAEELEQERQREREKLREELKKPYRPKKPMEFIIEAKSHALRVGDRFKLSKIPSMDECVKNIHEVVLTFSSVEGNMSLEKANQSAVKKRIVRLSQTFGDNLIFEVISKSNSSIYTLRAIPTNH